MQTTIRIKIMNKNDQTLAVGHLCGDGVSIVHTALYQSGDRITIETGSVSGLYMIQLDEALPEAIVYLNGDTFSFPIPTGDELLCYSPKAFTGSCHLITVREATEEECKDRRNLAFNPYDRHASKGFFPHATANVETRNEAAFVARNAIDGIFENSSHGAYPYSSWGINCDPKAELRLDFGRMVSLDSLRLTLRADFPHDNWWKNADILFSDGSSITMTLEKSAFPQEISFDEKDVEWVILSNLIKSDGPSPFPALTQIETYGIECKRYLD